MRNLRHDEIALLGLGRLFENLCGVRAGPSLIGAQGRADRREILDAVGRGRHIVRDGNALEFAAGFQLPVLLRAQILAFFGCEFEGGEFDEVGKEFKRDFLGH